MIRSVNKNRTADIGIFVIITGIYTAMTFYLFYHHGHVLEYQWATDMYPYLMHMQGYESGYIYPYPIFFVVGRCFMRFTSAENAIATATTFFNSCTLIVLKVYLNIYFDGKKSIKRGAALTLLSLSLCIVSMLYMPRGIRLPGIYYRCLGVYTANPYWNATTLAARPFAVIAFFQFWRIFYEKKQVVSEYVIFSASLLLSTMTKPSFTLPFIAMCGVVICADIFKSRFGNLKKDVVIGVLFIPTFVDMLYQYVQVFRGSEGGGMGIGIARVWSRYCGNIPLAILLAMAFPIVLTLVARFCKWEGRFGSMLATGWLFYVINLIMALFLYEKGYREYDFNFSWGYMYGIFFAFVIGVFALTEQYDRIREKKIEARRSLIGIYLSTAIYAIHLICGIIYLADMLRGGTYN